MGTRDERSASIFFAGKGGGTYLDIGANIGLTTIPVAQNPKVHCIALEPEPTNFRNLIANITANCEHGNVRALQLAAFSQAASIELELATGNLGDHRLRLTSASGLMEEHARPTIQVDAAPLDDVVGPIKGALAIKIDTQGSEPFVFAGGKQTLERADLLIQEFWPYGMGRMGGDVEQVIRYLEKTFDTLSIRSNNGEALASAIPLARAAALLRTFVRTKGSDPSFFVDLVIQAKR